MSQVGQADVERLMLPPVAPIRVVGIGASAGGLEAITQLLRRLPNDTGAAFVIVQHLDPNQPSHLVEILARLTPMKVDEVTHGDFLQPNHVYVVPGHHIVTLDGGKMRVHKRDVVRSVPFYPIDQFFAALAADQFDKSIGVVLSGTGEDGATGIAAIRNAGGLAMAQDPTTAKYDSMPVAAAKAGADFVLSPESIADELVLQAKPGRDVWTSQSQPTEGAAVPALPPDQLTAVIDWLRGARGADFSSYKRATIARRIARRMGYLQIERPDTYVTYLAGHPAEVDRLYEDILIKVTSFFREPEAFEVLQRDIFPQILSRKAPGAPIRIWVPGCATGEEAYSLAICLAETMEANRGTSPARPVQIFATDISGTAIAQARAGLFNVDIKASVSSARLERFFVEVDGRFQIDRGLRDQCVFARHDVTKDPPFSCLDLVSCRNLLIYFNQTLQRRVLATFHFALDPNGFLLLGDAETVGTSSDLFAPAGTGSKIFTRRTVSAVIPDFTQEFMAGRTALERPLKPLAAPTPMQSLSGDIGRALCEGWQVNGVVVNEAMEILQFLGDTSPYLAHPSGEMASFSIFSMAPAYLRVSLRLMVHEAMTTGKAVRRSGLSAGPPVQDTSTVAVDVMPFNSSATGQQHFLVIFELEPLVPIIVGEGPDHPLQEQDRCVALLSQELAETKSYLNMLVEGEQAANEELKSASEELLSSNEELQSTNQELQTAREETQAINEELRTVNDELKRRHQDLNQAHSDLINTLASSQVALVMVSDQLVCRRLTSAAERILGLVGIEATGQPIERLMARFSHCHLDSILRDVITTLESRELAVQDSGGHWYELRLRPYVNVDKKVDGAVIVLSDIEEGRQQLRRVEDAGEAARLARDEALRANRAKSDFLANMSHELRTPLTTILGYAELLAEDPNLRDDQVISLGKIQRSVHYVTQLVDDVLDLAKIEASKLQVTLVPVYWLPVLGDILAPLRQQALDKGLRFDLTFSGAVPECISTDPLRFRQILTNVIANAVKFTDKGTVNALFKISEEGQLICTVSDTGCGLSEAQALRIFQQFGQGDTSLTRQYGGSGLGLCLARRLARALGGDVVLTSSTPGIGSVFTAAINPGPITNVRMLTGVTEKDLNQQAILEASKVAKDEKVLAGVRILVVEDNADNRLLMTAILQGYGAEIAQSEDGALAQQQVLAADYDIVLMDIQMPNCDGYEALKGMRGSGYRGPVVAFTAHAMGGERETCIKAGFDDFATKPMPRQKLLDFVLRNLRPKSAQSRQLAKEDKRIV